MVLPGNIDQGPAVHAGKLDIAQMDDNEEDNKCGEDVKEFNHLYCFHLPKSNPADPGEHQGMFEPFDIGFTVNAGSVSDRDLNGF